jgi:hypothetical protein
MDHGSRAERRLEAKRLRESEPHNHTLMSMSTNNVTLSDLDAMFEELPEPTQAGGNDAPFGSAFKVPDGIDTLKMKPAYVLVGAQSNIRQCCQILAMHFHVVNGETMEELYQTETRQLAEPVTPLFHM